MRTKALQPEALQHWRVGLQCSKGCVSAAALGLIQAATCVIAGSHDLYFTSADCRAEAALIPGARFLELPSALGHRAGNPRDQPREQAFIRHAVDALLPSP
jgi:homoserine O-acetyltransferase